MVCKKGSHRGRDCLLKLMQVVKQLLQRQLAIFLLGRGEAPLAPLHLLPQLLTAGATSCFTACRLERISCMLGGGHVEDIRHLLYMAVLVLSL